MALDKDAILEQIDAVLQPALTGHMSSGAAGYYLRGGVEAGSTSHVSQTIASLASTIERLTPVAHHYRKTATQQIEQYGTTNKYTRDALIGVLQALRQDVEAGRTQSLVEVVHAEVFTDYLDMASELQKGGYKDAAAVIAGSTLEGHLRALAVKAQVPIVDSQGDPAKASKINDDLKAKDVYKVPEHRQVQAWLDIRNDAAHGNRDEYDHKQVAYMIQGVIDFLVRHPA